MRGNLLLSLLLSPLPLAIAAPFGGFPHVVHEKRSLPPAWSQIGRLDPYATLPVKIGLKQSNLDQLEVHLLRVSDPKSPSYGQHYTASEVANLFAPSKEAVNEVKIWLTDAGISADRLKISPSRGWINFEAQAYELEALLQTEYSVYQHNSGYYHTATLEYSIPAHLQQHIDMILPTLHFDVKGGQKNSGKSLKKRSMNLEARSGMQAKIIQAGPGFAHEEATTTNSLPVVSLTSTATSSSASPAQTYSGYDIHPTSLDNCGDFVTPECLRYLYEIPVLNASCVNKNNSFGIVEYSPLSFLELSDLALFVNKFLPGAKNYEPTFYYIDGGYLNETLLDYDGNFELHGEANLDIEFATALTYPTKINYYQTGRSDALASFNDFIDAIDGSYCSYEGGDDLSEYLYNGTAYPFDDPYFPKSECGAFPQSKVISTSYGDDEFQLTAKYEERQCSEYGKLGMMGITWVYSAGDSGVGGGLGCIDPAYGPAFDNLTYTNGSYGLFTPDFPAGCPYVLTVGGTVIAAGNSVYDKEVVANVPAQGGIYAGGGGFSWVFPMPSYQKSAVENWINTYSSDSEQPAKSLYNSNGNARGFPDISANSWNFTLTLGGDWTWVGGTSAAAPTVGSILTLINNERLNAGKSSIGFINPTIYENPSAFNDIVTGNNPGCGDNGFFATSSWDPASGLGTPNYPKLLKIFMDLP